MTIENSQTKIDPKSRKARAVPIGSAVVTESPPTLPGRGGFEVPASTIRSPQPSPTAPDSQPADFDFGPSVVGRYFIEKKLGQGGMGAVFLCRDRRLMDKHVVVKILLGVGSEWGNRKFLQEIEALTRVNHPGIVSILDAGELANGKQFLVMEYIGGGTLQDAITPGGIDLKRAGNFIKQIGSALAAAHDTGIYHRDLKPANIMLERMSGGEEKARIIDFGIAKVHDSLVTDHTVAGRFGTPVYMSPEQFRIEKITAASDIYSMGAIAYELVTGRAPFDPMAFQNLGDMYTAGVQVRPRELRRELPERAQQLILKALSVRPQDRFQNAAEFGDAFAQSLVEGRAIRVRPPKLKEVAKRLPDRARFIKVAAPVFVVMLMVIAVVVTVSLIAPVFLGGNKKPESKPTFEAPQTVLPSTVNSSSLPLSSFTYWLTVDKARPGQGDKNPYESLGTETFEGGDRFQLNVFASNPGYLYVLNEGASTDGTMSLTLIHPLEGDGSAKLDSGQLVQSGKGRFAGQPGREQFWVVWSRSPIDQLEAARDVAFKVRNSGRITDQEVVSKVREFLTSYPSAKSEVAIDDTNHRTVISGNGDSLVKLLELEHR